MSGYTARPIYLVFVQYLAGAKTRCKLLRAPVLALVGKISSGQILVNIIIGEIRNKVNYVKNVKNFFWAFPSVALSALSFGLTTKRISLPIANAICLGVLTYR